MLNERYKFLSILNYPMKEKLFKEIIGTGKELKELVDNNILIKESEEVYKVNFKSHEIIEMSNNLNDEKLHESIINEFYINNLRKEVNDDYEIFINNYLDYINLAYHYRKIHRYDEAIESIFYIAKKLVYWGYGEELLCELDNYDNNMLKDINKLWKQYYKFFCQLMKPSEDIEETKLLEFFNTIENIVNDETIYLYLEAKNLKGIYYMNVKYDNSTALEIFKEAMNYYKNVCETNVDERIEVSYGRILENIAICEEDRVDIQDVIKYLNQSREVFEKYENYYELTKNYFVKVIKLNNIDDIELDDMIKDFGRIKSMLEENTFPDIERNFYNLLSDIALKDNNDFEQYIEIKREVLIRDLVLYFDYFMVDWIDILKAIEEYWDDYKIEISRSLKGIEDFLLEVDMKDELHFIVGIKDMIDNKDISVELEKIMHSDMKEFAYRYIENLHSSNDNK